MQNSTLTPPEVPRLFRHLSIFFVDHSSSMNEKYRFSTKSKIDIVEETILGLYQRMKYSAWRDDLFFLKFKYTSDKIMLYNLEESDIEYLNYCNMPLYCDEALKSVKKVIEDFSYKDISVPSYVSLIIFSDGINFGDSKDIIQTFPQNTSIYSVYLGVNDSDYSHYMRDLCPHKNNFTSECTIDSIRDFLPND